MRTIPRPGRSLKRRRCPCPRRRQALEGAKPVGWWRVHGWAMPPFMPTSVSLGHSASRFAGCLIYPIGSMYGIYANIGGILMVNVTIYSIHGSYGHRDSQFIASHHSNFGGNRFFFQSNVDHPWASPLAPSALEQRRLKPSDSPKTN